jgi:hypothetical protein
VKEGSSESRGFSAVAAHPEGDVMFTKPMITLLGLLALAIGMHAQDTVRANIPFDFSVGGQSLPTSNYEISRIEDQTEETLAVRNLNDQSESKLVLARTNDATGRPKLVFDRYGGKYFLVAIVTQDGSYDLPQSKEEQRLVSHAALRVEVSAEGR